MVRMLLALFVSGAVCLGGMNAALSAQGMSPRESSALPAADSRADRNLAPLAPGKAAGIVQAQGQGETIWNIIGLGFIGGVVLAMILVDGHGDQTSAPTTTN